MELAIKVDVDTEQGTRIGVPQLLTLFAELNISATFLFSLGPDNTGRAIKRIFRPGFLSKIRRTKVMSNYGIKTLLYGVLIPGPNIAKKNAAIMRLTHALDHEVGIHCYDHIRWQDHVHSMSATEVQKEFEKSLNSFENVFGFPAKTAGAAGWQANTFSFAAYDKARFLYASDTRGYRPFYPRIGDTVFKTLQVPSTLPTLDEVLGLPGNELKNLTDFYLSQLQPQQANILTIHAELEGMNYLSWFREFLLAVQARNISIVKTAKIAENALKSEKDIPICGVIQASVPGRSGKLAVQEN